MDIQREIQKFIGIEIAFEHSCVSTNLMRTVWIFREKFKNSSSGARVLHMTSYSIIPRRCQDDNDKEMYQNVKGTSRACRAIVFAN